MDPQGLVSKVSLIVVTKQDGTNKRRVIVDLRSSCAHSVCPERIVSPWAADAIRDLRCRVRGLLGCLHALTGRPLESAVTVTRSSTRRAASKKAKKILSEVESLLCASMVGARRLRSLAISLIAGLVPRLRWVVKMGVRGRHSSG